MTQPIEPSAHLRTTAHQLREIYVALQDAGFSDEQAMMLLMQVVAVE